MATPDEKIVEVLTKILAPALRSLKTPHLLFLLFLAVVVLSFYLRNCGGSVFAVVAFTITITIIALLGCCLEIVLRRLAAEEKISDEFKSALRDKVRQTNKGQGREISQFRSESEAADRARKS